LKKKREKRKVMYSEYGPDPEDGYGDYGPEYGPEEDNTVMIVILSLAGIVLLVVGYFCLFSSTPDQDKIARGAIMIGDTPVKIPLIGKTDDDLCTPTAAGVALGVAATAGVAAAAYAYYDPEGFRSKFGDTVGDAAGAKEVDNTYLYASVGGGALALGGLVYHFRNKVASWIPDGLKKNSKKFWEKCKFWKKSEKTDETGANPTPPGNEAPKQPDTGDSHAIAPGQGGDSRTGGMPAVAPGSGAPNPGGDVENADKGVDITKLKGADGNAIIAAVDEVVARLEFTIPFEDWAVDIVISEAQQKVGGKREETLQALKDKNYVRQDFQLQTDYGTDN